MYVTSGTYVDMAMRHLDVLLESVCPAKSEGVIEIQSGYVSASTGAAGHTFFLI